MVPRQMQFCTVWSHKNQMSQKLSTLGASGNSPFYRFGSPHYDSTVDTVATPPWIGLTLLTRPLGSGRRCRPSPPESHRRYRPAPLVGLDAVVPTPWIGLRLPTPSLGSARRRRPASFDRVDAVDPPPWIRSTAGYASQWHEMRTRRNRILVRVVEGISDVAAAVRQNPKTCKSGCAST